MQQLEKFNALVRDLEAGRVRVAERTDGEWKVNSWVKETILEGFRYGKLTDMSEGQFSFFDKDTIPARKFSADDGVRIVPGGSAVRTGAYLAPSVIVMPPSYINIGAYVDADTMIDSHALVGSCAQVGRHVHLSAASQLGGVLEPVGALKAHVPNENTGDIMGETTKRRGRVLGMTPDEDGMQVVEAGVPMAEMQDFTTFLRQLTQGRGWFTFDFVRYEQLPQMLESKVIEQAKALGNLNDDEG